MRDQLPRMVRSTTGLQALSLSAWFTVIGLAVPWKASHRMAVG
jgi:hypothetical protein